MENKTSLHTNKSSTFWEKLTFKMKESFVTNWIIAFATIVNLLILLYSVIPIGKAEVIVRGKNELEILLHQCKYLNVYHHLTFRNIGQKTGEIASVEGLIVSLSTNQGVPIFKQHMLEFGYYVGTDYSRYFPCLDLIFYPNDWWSERFAFFKRASEVSDLDNFNAGDYEYFIVFKNDKGKLINAIHYRFSINESEIYTLKNNCQLQRIYVQLVQLQNKHRREELLNLLSEFKN